MSVTEKPLPGQSVFLNALAPHAFWFSISVSAIAIGLSQPLDWLRAGLFWGGGMFAALLLIILWNDYFATDNLLDAHIARENAITQQMLPAPIAPEAKPRVPFPPVRFVYFIWAYRGEHGKFPSVRECGTAGFTESLVQEWYTQCVTAGAIINRSQAQGYAGDPAPEWSRERFEQAAMSDNALHPLPRAE